MNSFLLSRQAGIISPHALALAQSNRLLQALQTAPNVHFALTRRETSAVDGPSSRGALGLASVAHAAGVNSIAIDRFEGRYLLSGGADSSVALWDLESENTTSDGPGTYLPYGSAARTSTTESLGITHISFYPFDSLAFLTSGYDGTVKISSSETLKASATFDIGSTVYSHATSAVATHLLVACASQHPAIRLVDLRTGSGTHSLAGHSGSVLTVAWHPKDENTLASGGSDGTCRLWDIRRSASSLGVLDMEDSIGIAGYDGKGAGARRRERGRAHNGAVNGVVWTDDGQYLVSTGQDERMRVWDMTTGANTLANFGPALKNNHTTVLAPLIAPSHLSPVGSELLYYPNPTEILSFDMHSGSLQKRLRVAELQKAQTADSGVRNLTNRTTSLAWRAHRIEMYSSHADGTIRCWQPRTWEDDAADQEDGALDSEEDVVERKRKRDEFDQVVGHLANKR
ncbi:hypothetical protein LTR36_007146 [Oleoguttula mirabilis]|uniref:WD40 repeat-like protein n=1 Tax=Oleoguttula mirabilis TaxID=1507867 RepID=A0AAV9JB31_9PEZI|nr:hypothetical protein LTR36_007146 [Oleoguttula mirabilis]